MQTKFLRARSAIFMISGSLFLIRSGFEDKVYHVWHPPTLLLPESYNPRREVRLSNEPSATQFCLIRPSRLPMRPVTPEGPGRRCIKVCLIFTPVDPCSAGIVGAGGSEPAALPNSWNEASLHIFTPVDPCSTDIATPTGDGIVSSLVDAIAPHAAHLRLPIKSVSRPRVGLTIWRSYAACGKSQPTKNLNPNRVTSKLSRLMLPKLIK